MANDKKATLAEGRELPPDQQVEEQSRQASATDEKPICASCAHCHGRDTHQCAKNNRLF
jgi:cytochrome c553